MSKKILIIDDQPFMIKLIEYNLKKEGYDTITETDGLKAFEQINEIAPDLIILDVRMPKITGTELCRRFRLKNGLAEIPIIILTGQLQQNIEAEALEAGASDFMTKPFSPNELVTKIKNYWRTMNNSRNTDLFRRFPVLEEVQNDFYTALDILTESISKQGTLYVCGNGGSAADADHMVGELMKGFLKPRKVNNNFRRLCNQAFAETGDKLADNLQEGIKAVSLNGHPALATAYGNDVCPQMVFAQQLYVLGNSKDVFAGLSTSGNSENVVNALKIAKILKIKSICFTGSHGGECAKLADCSIRVPEHETYKIQELHLPLYHALCALLEERFYG